MHLRNGHPLSVGVAKGIADTADKGIVELPTRGLLARGLLTRGMRKRVWEILRSEAARDHPDHQTV